jgi:hypothetical protein
MAAALVHEANDRPGAIEPTSRFTAQPFNNRGFNIAVDHNGADLLPQRFGSATKAVLLIVMELL